MGKKNFPVLSAINGKRDINNKLQTLCTIIRKKNDVRYIYLYYIYIIGGIGFIIFRLYEALIIDG